MATTIANLIRGTGNITVGSSTTASTTTNLLQPVDDIVAEFVQETDTLVVSTQGNIDETRRNRFVRVRLGPCAYPPSQSTLMAFLWPWVAATPVPGSSLFSSSQPIYILSTNGDGLVVYNCAVVKPPDLILDISKSIVGPVEIIGLIRNTFDPETANSFYKINASVSYTSPVLLQSGDLIGRQRYYGAWATGPSSFASFQAEKGITITHETTGDFIAVQGQQVDWSLRSYRAMARLIPVGPTAADIDTALNMQGTSTAKQGSRIGLNPSMGDVVFTGQFGLTATIKNAVLKTAGQSFGGVTLRTGEIGFVGTFNLTTTTPTGGLTLA